MFRELVGRCWPLSGEQSAALESHYALMCRWNRVLNLTRVEAVEEAVERHYCESLFLAAKLPDQHGLRVVDVGSGAGFPGIPVAVVRPDALITLVESHQRKAVFLREATRGLRNVRVLACRAEAVTGEFDWLVSRAVSYEDLGKLAPRRGGEAAPGLGARMALLTGAEEPPADWGLQWDVLPLPWGRQRFLRVSRGT